MATPRARQTSAILAMSSRQIALDQERLRHRGEVVEAERTRLRHPVVDVEPYFGRDVADRPCGRDRNDHMKVLYGRLAGQDEVGAALRARPTQPTRLLLGLPRFLLRSRRPLGAQRRRPAPEAVGACQPSAMARVEL